MPSCPSCGRALPEGTAFCPFDGTNLKQATSQTSPMGGYGSNYSPPSSGGMYPADSDLSRITRRLARLTYIAAAEAIILAAIILILLYGP